MGEKQNAGDLQVGFGFEEKRFFHLEGVDIIRVLDVIVDYRHVGLLGHFVCDNRYT